MKSQAIRGRAQTEFLKFRIRKGWTLRGMSEITGISVSTLWRLERRVIRPSPRSTVKLQDALGLSEPQLFDLLWGPGAEHGAWLRPAQIFSSTTAP